MHNTSWSLTATLPQLLNLIQTKPCASLIKQTNNLLAAPPSFKFRCFQIGGTARAVMQIGGLFNFNLFKLFHLQYFETVCEIYLVLP